MLGFKAECSSVLVFIAAFKSIFPFHKVSAIKLYARLLGVNIHYYLRFIAGYGCRMCKASGSVFIKHKIMVVTGPVFYLLMVSIYTCTYCYRLAKIEGSSFNRLKFSC